MANIIDSLKLGDIHGIIALPYGTCSTAAATAAKTVSLTNFVLETGASVRIKFSNANSASTPTLNVNSTGAKNIRWNNANLPSTQYWTANQVIDFVYDGSYWQMIGAAKDTDTHYTTGLTAGASGTTTNAAATNPYIKVKDNSTHRAQIRLVGSGATIVKSDANGNVTISSTNTDTKVYNTVLAEGGAASVDYHILLGRTVDGMTGTVNNGATESVSHPSVFFTDEGFLYANEVYGAVWNDYAEYRQSDCLEAGRVICENGDDTLSLATERLQPGAEIISDTFGFAIGKTDKAQTPIAVSGRVLAYTYEDRNSYKPGDAVCAAPGGTVSKMTREEIREYPERIIGTVSAIPSYETWGTGNVPVNGRIWIKIK